MDKAAIIAKAAGAFNKVRPGLMPGERLFLLRKKKESSQFESIFEITADFWSRWSTYREQTVFMWASNAPEWVDRVAKTTHVGFGIPDTDGDVQVFEISSDQRDRLAPTGANLLWKLYGVRQIPLRFQIEATP